MPGKDSFDETVGHIAISRLMGEAKQVAELRGLPPDVRYATPEEELDLFDTWDDAVDPQAVLSERFQHHVTNGMPEDGALAEAILEASAAGFSKRLEMAQGAGRLTLTEQTKWLEDTATKSRERRMAQQQADTGATEVA
jgi:hypothetical protein